MSNVVDLGKSLYDTKEDISVRRLFEEILKEEPVDAVVIVRYQDGKQATITTSSDARKILWLLKSAEFSLMNIEQPKEQP